MSLLFKVRYAPITKSSKDSDGKENRIIFQELFSAQVSAFPVSTELDEDQDRWSQRFFFRGSENFKDFGDDGA